MTEPSLSTRRQLELMQHLQQLANERAQAETRITVTLATEHTAAREDHDTTQDRLTKDYAQQRHNLENDYALAKQAAEAVFGEGEKNNQVEYQTSRHSIEAAYKQQSQAIEKIAQESHWQAMAVYDAAKDQPHQLLEAASKRLISCRAQTDGLERDAQTLLAMRNLTEAAPSNPPQAELSDNNQANEPGEQLERRLQSTINQARQAVLDMQSQRLASLLLERNRLLTIWSFACVVCLVVAGFVIGWAPLKFIIAGFVSGTVLTGVFYAVLGPRSRRQSLDQFRQISELLASARQLEADAQQSAQCESEALKQRITHQRDHDLVVARSTQDEAIAAARAEQSDQLQQAQAVRRSRSSELTKRRDAALAVAESDFPPRLETLAEERRTSVAQIESRFQQRHSEAQQTHDDDWNAMALSWREGFEQIAAEIGAMQADCARLFPDWVNTDWNSWQRPTEPPPAIRFGCCPLPLKHVKKGLSQDQRLVPEQTSLELPALMTLDEQPRLVITTKGAARAAAVDVLQQLMLRLLTAMPAGKVRFTLIDPVGLGENFAAFTHLNDYDEQLVGSKIWTDSRDIDDRLRLLSEHLQRVIQKYLRNEFETISDYNQHAGEVAEPYHVLVVADFPAGLSDSAIRRLVTIATTGPRCGVYTLISVDSELRLPNEFDLTQLTSGAVHLESDGDRLLWRYPLFEKLELQLDPLPPRDQLNRVLAAAGRESRQASRVEVPFSLVAPQNGQMWHGSTKTELSIPIGRASAKNLQLLRLGLGTAQHVLISGKTGSGKSTLLHALITNLALYFSPDEVELYLVDFKKGVEFKTYATGGLPHARVIAIQSEREFGLSVLERLDEELKQRGDLFRQLGVQDLPGYRQKWEESQHGKGATDPLAEPSERLAPLPRVLLIVDEFQELFIEDDKLSQDASLLLDRLVRQGRAFGIHVLLGSQTLAGAYSLARSTLGQMAVRIALECSDADAHLILSDENTAARMLNRPGEAIYNDQNGLVAGNSPFQVVWLPDDQRQEHLASIRQCQLAEKHSTEPTIVFEGNVPADPLENDALREVFSQEHSAEATEPTIWLGSAVKIGPPTQLILRRQGGSHLLIVGGEEPLALGILANAVLALAGQQQGLPAQMTVLDGTRAESTEQGAWKTIANTTAAANIQRIGPRQAAAVIQTLADEVDRRNGDADRHHLPHYLVIHDLAQFRDLRVTETEFSFTSNKDQEASVDQRFRDILREGPRVGVHLLCWCDSYNSLTRSIDRLTLREIDYRVALQISAGDSTSLIDSPAASRLGEHRAILYRDDLGSHVKFRPYGRPSAEWLAWVVEQLEARGIEYST